MIDGFIFFDNKKAVNLIFVHVEALVNPFCKQESSRYRERFPFSCAE